ncbi:MAG: TaqI-like C-terminal specificity domain-containing protein [Solirubrobacterales bacterium]
MTRTISQDLWRETPRNVFRLDLTAERFAQLQALWRWAVKLGDICRVNYGAQISSAEPGAFGRDRYLSQSDDGLGDAKRFYEGRDMRPWGMTWNGTWLDWAAHNDFYGARTRSLFENDKLSIRHISGEHDSFVAWVDEDGYYTDHGVIHCVPYHLVRDEPSYRVHDGRADQSEPYDLYYLLGILMSRPVLSYYAGLYATGSLQGAFSHVYPNTVKELPIPQLDGPPQDAHDDWFERVEAAVGGERYDRGALRAAFPSRSEAISALTAASRRRVALESERAERNANFGDFMRSRIPDWRWPAGATLERPPEEVVFLESVGPQLESVDAVATIRNQFREQTAAAAESDKNAELLERGVDVLADRAFSLAI